jgi:ribosomal protein S18 acetylase RimI-like enzyme
MIEEVTTESGIKKIVRLAEEIWTEHYTSIIGADQVKYMLSKFHSEDVIANQIDREKYSYFLIEGKDNFAGYIGVQSRSEELHLSKLYILSSERGLGAGKAAMNFVKDFASENGFSKISLTVNKNNTNTIAAYDKLGFVNVGDLYTDIGGGYAMDDYAMELTL